MKVVNISEVRNNFFIIDDIVYYNNEEVIIHKECKENAIVMLLNKYNSIKEINCLLSSSINMKGLLIFLKDTREGKTFGKEFSEK